MKTFNDLRNELKKENPSDWMLMEIIGKLMATRDRKKITQRQLSEMTGLPQKTISRIENGKDIPKLSTIIILANALGLQLTMIEKNNTDEQAAALMD